MQGPHEEKKKREKERSELRDLVSLLKQLYIASVLSTHTEHSFNLNLKIWRGASHCNCNVGMTYTIITI
jgi:hypothetical protein